ncbi:MAG: hypothetical protein NZ933_06800 [Bacteroidia bacterium]|nr:hypothetical protein [Bacteroidia bacterium]
MEQNQHTEELLGLTPLLLATVSRMEGKPETKGLLTGVGSMSSRVRSSPHREYTEKIRTAWENMKANVEQDPLFSLRKVNLKYIEGKVYKVYRLEMRNLIESRTIEEVEMPYKGGRISSGGRIDPWEYIERIEVDYSQLPIESREYLLDPIPGCDEVYTCEECKGDGKISCEICSGTGNIICPKCEGDRHLRCRNCDGHGEVRCRKCYGAGRVKDYRSKGYIRCDKCHGRGYYPCSECRNGYITWLWVSWRWKSFV